MKTYKPFSMIIIILIICACSENEEPTNFFISTPDETLQINTIGNVAINNSGIVINDNNNLDFYFGFLDGDGSSSKYLEMPVESSSTNLIVGRWIITKISVDANNDGNKVDYDYQDFKNKDCGRSFLQFNNDGVVFENSYFYDSKVGTCNLYSEIDDYEYITEYNIKIYSYSNIYIIKLTQEELVLKYDWNFENSLYGPTQVYYHYKRGI